MGDRRQAAFRQLLFDHVTSAADSLRRGTALLMKREHDLSLAQMRTLSLIEHLQPVRLRDVAADADADKAQVSRVVTSLVSRGLVTRRALVGDARSAHLELTPAGHAKVQAVTRTLAERDQALRATMHGPEADQLVALLARVRETADAWTREEERLERAGRAALRQRAA